MNLKRELNSADRRTGHARRRHDLCAVEPSVGGAQAQAALHRHLQPIRQLRGATKEISALVQKVTLDLQQETVESRQLRGSFRVVLVRRAFFFLAD